MPRSLDTHRVHGFAKGCSLIGGFFAMFGLKSVQTGDWQDAAGPAAATVLAFGLGLLFITSLVIRVRQRRERLAARRGFMVITDQAVEN